MTFNKNENNFNNQFFFEKTNSNPFEEQNIKKSSSHNDFKGNTQVNKKPIDL